MTCELVGSEKQIQWAEKIKEGILIKVRPLLNDADFSEIEMVTSALWWIDRRDYPLDDHHLPDLIGCAWLQNSGFTELPKATLKQIESALRNSGRLEPMKYSFGSMCGTLYTHILITSNGSKYAVRDKVVAQVRE